MADDNLTLDLSDATLVETEDNNQEELALDLSGAEKVENEPVEEKLTSAFAILDKARDAGLEGWENYELPEPDMTMYDDIERSGVFGGDSYETSMKRYQMYANHPLSETTIDGRVSYKGKVVPFPKQGLPLIGDHSPDMSEMLYGGVRNTVGNVAELAGAGIDAGRNYMQENVGQAFIFNKDGEFDPDWKSAEEIAELTDEEFQAASIFGAKDLDLTGKAQENIASVKPGDSIGNALLMEGTSMMVPGVLAMKLINYTGKGSKLAKFLAFEAGAVAGTSSEGGSLFIGENAMFKGVQDVFPLLKGIEVSPEDPKYAKVLANRANILMEAMAVGKTLEKGISGISWGVRFGWSITGAPLATMARPTAKEDALAREILDRLTGVTDDPKSMEEARKGILKLVEDNKEVWQELPEGLADDIKYTADTMTALERAIANEDFAGAQEIVIRAQNLKKGVLQSGNAPETTLKQAMPSNEFERVTLQTEDALGGNTGINNASDEIAASGMNEVNTASAKVYNLENEIVKVDEALAQVIETGDAGIISKVNDLENSLGFQINAGANQSADAIRNNLSEASKIMDTEKNRLFGLVKGGEVDVNDMVSTLQSLQPNQLDIAASALPGDSMLGKLLNQVKLGMREVDGKMVKETEEQMRERVAKWADKNGLDYGTLFTDVRVSLSDSIGRMTAQNASAAEKGAAQTLIKFKQWIDDDAIKFVEETGDDATVEAAQDALNYFKNDWAKYWDDGSVLTDVGRLRRETLGRGKQGPMFLDESRNLITDSFSNRNREVVGNMVDLLKRPEAGESATDVVDYIIGDTLTKISNRVDDPSKLANLDISDIRTSLQDYSAIIRNNFPQEADRLDEFLGTLRTAKGDKAALESQLKIAQETAKKAEDKIFKRELDAFFKSAGVPNVNGFESFKSLFNNPNALRVNADGTTQGVLTDVITRAQATGNPLVMDGIQSAYSRYIRENFLSATREAGGNRMVGLAALNKSENNISQILQYGDEVYKDTPLVMQAFRGILEEAGLVQRSRNSKAVGVSSGTAEAQQAVAAVNRTVTMTLGVLSRLGARVRAGATGVIMSKVDPIATAQVLDKLMADPDYFVEVAKRVTKQDGAVDPDGAMLLRQWLIRSGIYSEDNEPSEEDFLLQLADAELGYRKGKAEVEQTIDALGNAILQ
jgi:hypothetical protein